MEWIHFDHNEILHIKMVKGVIFVKVSTEKGEAVLKYKVTDDTVLNIYGPHEYSNGYSEPGGIQLCAEKSYGNWPSLDGRSPQ